MNEYAAAILQRIDDTETADDIFMGLVCQSKPNLMAVAEALGVDTWEGYHGRTIARQITDAAVASRRLSA